MNSGLQSRSGIRRSPRRTSLAASRSLPSSRSGAVIHTLSSPPASSPGRTGNPPTVTGTFGRTIRNPARGARAPRHARNESPARASGTSRVAQCGTSPAAPGRRKRVAGISPQCAARSGKLPIFRSVVSAGFGSAATSRHSSRWPSGLAGSARGTVSTRTVTRWPAIRPGSGYRRRRASGANPALRSRWFSSSIAFERVGAPAPGRRSVRSSLAFPVGPASQPVADLTLPRADPYTEG